MAEIQGWPEGPSQIAKMLLTFRKLSGLRGYLSGMEAKVTRFLIK